MEAPICQQLSSTRKRRFLQGLIDSVVTISVELNHWTKEWSQKKYLIPQTLHLWLKTTLQMQVEIRVWVWQGTRVRFELHTSWVQTRTKSIQIHRPSKLRSRVAVHSQRLTTICPWQTRSRPASKMASPQSKGKKDAKLKFHQHSERSRSREWHAIKSTYSMDPSNASKVMTYRLATLKA